MGRIDRIEVHLTITFEFDSILSEFSFFSAKVRHSNQASFFIRLALVLLLSFLQGRIRQVHSSIGHREVYIFLPRPLISFKNCQCPNHYSEKLLVYTVIFGKYSCTRTICTQTISIRF